MVCSAPASLACRITTCRMFQSTFLRRVRWPTLVLNVRGWTLLIVLLMLGSLAPMASGGSDAAGGRAAVDFRVTDIRVEFQVTQNATRPLDTWNNSDFSTTEFGYRNDPHAVTITVKQAGSSLSLVIGDVTFEVWHPIGFLTFSASYSTPGLLGGQSNQMTISWQPDASHSFLSNSGDLSGGYRLRAEVSNDTTKSSHVKEREAPIATFRDRMEDQSGLYTYDDLVFLPVGYDTDDTVTGAGGFQYGSTNSKEGDAHWRVSAPGADYGSNRHDRIVLGWFNAAQDCSDYGHGLGHGNLDTPISTNYGTPFCEVNFPAYSMVTAQIVTYGWGVMGPGDELSMEMRTGGGQSVYANLSDYALTGVAGQWKRVIWNTSEDTAQQAYRLGFLLSSDESGANEGIHVDDFIIFAVDKVSNYTVTLTCDDPPGGYSLDPGQTAAMHCSLRNNGYSPQVLELDASISNQTWLLGGTPPISIDSTNERDHDHHVTLGSVQAQNTTDFWVNLTVPPGANVEDLTWNLSVIGGAHERAFRTVSVRVMPSYVVDLATKTTADREMELLPAATDTSWLTLTNTGNQPASYWIRGFFEDPVFASSAVLTFVNTTDVVIPQPIALGLGETIQLGAKVVAPAEPSPSTFGFSVTAEGVSPADARDTLALSIEVPQQRAVRVAADETTLTLPADGVLRQIPLTVTNLGNSPDIYDLRVKADRLPGTSLSTLATQTLEAFDGEATIALNLPMLIGTKPDFYTIRVYAESRSGTLPATDFHQIDLIVEKTHAVEVNGPDLAGQTFRGGDRDLTMKVSIRNTGNVDDAFDLKTIADTGIESVGFVGLPTGRTTTLAPLETTNVTVAWSFADGLQGQPQLRIVAASTGDTAVSSLDAVTFSVGSQGRLSITAPAAALRITEEGDYEVQVSVYNLHFVAQQVALDIDAGDWQSSLTARVRQQDATLQIAGNTQRSATVLIEVDRTALLNIDGTETLTLTIVAESDVDNDEAAINIELVGIDDTPPTRSTMVDYFAQNSGSIAVWVIGVITVIALLIGVVVVLLGGRDGDDDDLLDGAGYESSVIAQYGSVPPAPSVSQSPAPPGAHPPAGAPPGQSPGYPPQY